MRETRDIIYIIRAGIWRMFLSKYFWLDYKLIWKDTISMRYYKYIGCKYFNNHNFNNNFEGDYFCTKCGSEFTSEEHKAYERDNIKRNTRE
jgi:hypothetical protein